DQLAAAADPHPPHPGVPAGDDLADAEPELQRLAAVVGGVELLPGAERDPDVVHLHGVAGGRDLAVALGEVLDDEVGRRVEVREVDLWLVHGPETTAARESPGGRPGSRGV